MSASDAWPRTTLSVVVAAELCRTAEGGATYCERGAARVPVTGGAVPGPGAPNGTWGRGTFTSGRNYAQTCTTGLPIFTNSSNAGPGEISADCIEDIVAKTRSLTKVKQNIAVASKELPDELLEAVDGLNTRFDGKGRVLVRPSGTEPVIRVLAEAETEQEAAEACATISALVRRELG